MARAEERVGADWRAWVRARSAEGLSLRQMAPKLGVSAQLLSLWVNTNGGRVVTTTRVEFPSLDESP